jgi:hypothetical protein
MQVTPRDMVFAIQAARAYAAPSTPRAQAGTLREPDRADLSDARRRLEKVRDLVAARVRAGLDFAPLPMNPDAPLQLHRNPADRNAAAVGVDVGRHLDLRA